MATKEKSIEVVKDLDKEGRQNLIAALKETGDIPEDVGSQELLMQERSKAEELNKQNADLRTRAEAAEGQVDEWKRQMPKGKSLPLGKDAQEGGGDYEGGYQGMGAPVPLTCQDLLHVDADKFAGGKYAHLLGDWQKINDDLLTLQMIMRPAGQSMDIRQTKRYGQAWLQNELLRTSLAKLEQQALYTTGSTVGDEWIPLAYSDTWLDKVAGEAVIGPLFRRETIPTGKESLTWFVRSFGTGTAYLQGQATTDDAPEYTATNIATAQKAITPKVFAIRQVYSYEMVEDAAAGWLDQVQEVLAFRAALALDDAFLNGDTSAAFDTGHTYATGDVRRAFNGVRKWALSTETGMNQSAASYSDTYGDLLLKTLAGMSYYRGRPGDTVCLTSYYTGTMFALLKDRANNPIFNTSRTWAGGGLGGQVSTIFGDVPIYMSPLMLDSYSAAGIYDGTTTDRHAVVFVNRNAFILADKRQWMLETDRHPATGQHELILTCRLGFDTWYAAADDAYVATICYGIQ